MGEGKEKSEFGGKPYHERFNGYFCTFPQHANYKTQPTKPFTAWLRSLHLFLTLKHSSLFILHHVSPLLLLLLLHTPTKFSFSLSKMLRKTSPFFHKVSLHLLRLSLLVHRLRKPIFPKLLKRFKKRRELKLLNHSNDGEYQFTPLIPSYHRNQFKNRANPGLCSFLYLYCCLGNLKVEREWQLALEPFEIGDETGVAHDLFECGSADEGESVDQKAEKFIQSFYHQMRMQRQESL